MQYGSLGSFHYRVRAFELDLLDPKTRKSPDKLDALLANDFFEFTESCLIHTKHDVMTLLPTLPEEYFVVHDRTEKILSDDYVLVHYTIDREIIYNKTKRRTLCSSLWRYHHYGGRQMIFFQGTPAHTMISCIIE